MTDAEALSQSPEALELLDELALNPGHEVKLSITAPVAHIARQVLVARGLAALRTEWPPRLGVDMYYKITARGWLHVERMNRELDNT